MLPSKKDPTKKGDKGDEDDERLPKKSPKSPKSQFEKVMELVEEVCDKVRHKRERRPSESEPFFGESSSSTSSLPAPKKREKYSSSPGFVLSNLPLYGSHWATDSSSSSGDTQISNLSTPAQTPQGDPSSNPPFREPPVPVPTNENRDLSSNPLQEPLVPVPMNENLVSEHGSLPSVEPSDSTLSEAHSPEHKDSVVEPK